MKRTFLLTVVLALAGMAAAVTTTSDPLDLTVGDTVDLKLNSSPYLSPFVGGLEVSNNGVITGYNLGSDGVWAGNYLIDIENEVDNYQSFCIDLYQDPDVSYSSYTVVDNISADMEAMWGTYYNTVTSDAVMAAAFNLALWEMLYETSGTYDLSGGTFFLASVTASSSNNNGATYALLATYANTFMDSNTWTASADLVALESDSLQNFVAEIPEPTTLFLLGLGGLLLRRKK